MQSQNFGQQWVEEGFNFWKQEIEKNPKNQKAQWNFKMFERWMKEQ